MNKNIAMALTCCLLSACYNQDDALTVVSLGGVHAKTQKEAFYKPFTQKTNLMIVTDGYNGGMAKIRSMIETKQIDWDVVQVETANLIRGCSEGLFEPIDNEVIREKNQFINGNFSECGVGFFSWSIIVAYNKNKLSKAPNTWQDFWDVKDFPGYRGLQKSPMIALEAALLADGVKPEALYTTLETEQGIDRAFKKLDEIKPYIKWWEKGSQPLPMLLTGDVVMSTTYNGRAVIAEEEGKPIGLVWNDSFYDVDNFAIVKGSRHKKQAEEFIAFAVSVVPQKAFIEYSYYGFVNEQVASLISPMLLKKLPNYPDTMQHAYKINGNFWVEQGEALEKRFNVWASQQ